jgi:hypothetical protein
LLFLLKMVSLINPKWRIISCTSQDMRKIETMGMWRRKPQIQWLWRQCWVTAINRYCAMSQFDSEFLIPLKFCMPPRVNQILWHPCRKIISLVSKYCYNFVAGLLQTHSSYSKVLPIFFCEH